MRSLVGGNSAHRADRSTIDSRPGEASGGRARSPALEWGARYAALLLGVASAIVTFAGAWIPSYWGDEAASVVSAGRPLPSLLAMLGRVDAVHGLYYVFLHGWTGLVGTSEALVRLPSAIGIGLAVAGTVVLGGRLVGRSTGILAGVVLGVLPIATRMGIEARSYALAMAAGVWLTVWLQALVRRREMRWHVWSGFAVASAAAVSLFLFLGLLVFVHLTVLMVYRARRATVLRWLVASAAAAVLAAPILVAGISQHDQISFLARRDYASVESVLVRQWFVGAEWLAWVGWLLAIVAVATVAAVPSMRRSRRAVVIASVWITVPTAVLLAGDAWIAPSYNPRYLSYGAPALAVLIAVGLRGLGAVATT